MTSRHVMLSNIYILTDLTWAIHCNSSQTWKMASRFARSRIDQTWPGQLKMQKQKMWDVY